MLLVFDYRIQRRQVAAVVAGALGILIVSMPASERRVAASKRPSASSIARGSTTRLPCNWATRGPLAWAYRMSFTGPPAEDRGATLDARRLAFGL